jgi:NAD(P)-dependent dehydrogenase (short-subunit alcohol dehydrogenase family)
VETEHNTEHDSSQGGYSLAGKVYLITGASDGIGKSTAIECAKAGATVIIHGKSQPKLEAMYDHIVEQGYTQPVIYPLDFARLTSEDCLAVNEVIDREFGRLDGLFNNAGWLGAASPIQQFDIELWHTVIQINLNATFMLTQACLPLLNKADKSQIVFTLDNKRTAYWGAYGVAKAGLDAFMQILADELESSSITVTGVAPEKVNTAFRTRAFPGENPDQRSEVDEVVNAVMALLTGSLNDINGTPVHGNHFPLSAFQ